MKARQLARIYQKPYTDEQLEGEAKLIKRICKLSDDYEQWLVQFPGEAEEYQRTIHLRHLTS